MPSEGAKDFETALALSVFFGMFGFDRFVLWACLILRFYLGYPAIGLAKMCTLGFLFVGQVQFMLSLHPWHTSRQHARAHVPLCSVVVGSDAQLVDIVMIALQIVGPADGTSYRMPYYGPRAARAASDADTFVVDDS